MIFLSTILLSMFITLALIPLTKGLAVKLNIIDIPDARKAHLAPTPKNGGIAVTLGAIIPLLLWAPINGLGKAILIGVGIIVLFGLIDDIIDLNYKWKFAAQLVAALIVILYGDLQIKSLGMLLPEGVLLPSWLAIPLTVLVIVGITNAINLSDGLDGLAGGICLFSFICIGYLAFQAENITIALFSAAIAGGLFGFLRFNTYPAILFMGDAGSQFLGFTAITLSLGLTQTNTPLSPMLPLLLIGFPVLDTVTVMSERIARGRSPFIADRNHFHYKLIRLGLFHTESVLVIYILQAFLVTSAFILRFYNDWLILVCYLIFSGIIIIGFFIADKIGWQFKRISVADRIVKGRFAVLKEKNILIKISYRIIKYGIPLLLLVSCFLPANIPNYFIYFSIGMVALIAVTGFIKNGRIGGLRLSLYLTIPFIVYQSELSMPSWMNHNLQLAYNISFGILIIFVIMTLKFSRREGFKSTPMDFLILFIALVVPNLPDARIQSYHMGLIAAKIIVFFFSYDVLIAELRGDLTKIRLATMAALGVIIIKGLVL